MTAPGRDDVDALTVTSRDGTTIGVERRGSGPGLVLVQGAMATAVQYRELAAALASSFTVYAPDRRGRGTSPRPYEDAHDIARDVEDVDAVLVEAGASRVFGLSSGAVITLEAARTLPRVERAAAYEPPLYAGGIDRDGIAALNAEIERGDLGAALVSSLLVSGTAPGVLRALPRPAARLLARVVIAVDGFLPGPGATFTELLPGIRYDFRAVAGVDAKQDLLARIEQPVLVLSGPDSPAFLRDGARDLARVLPRGRHVELDGLGHSGPWNTRRGGRPDVVAAALRAFFA